MEVAPPQLTGFRVDLLEADKLPLCDKLISRLEKGFELFVFLGHKIAFPLNLHL